MLPLPGVAPKVVSARSKARVMLHWRWFIVWRDILSLLHRYISAGVHCETCLELLTLLDPCVLPTGLPSPCALVAIIVGLVNARKAKLTLEFLIMPPTATWGRPRSIESKPSSKKFSKPRKDGPLAKRSSTIKRTWYFPLRWKQPYETTNKKIKAKAYALLETFAAHNKTATHA